MLRSASAPRASTSSHPSYTQLGPVRSSATRTTVTSCAAGVHQKAFGEPSARFGTGRGRRSTLPWVVGTSTGTRHGRDAGAQWYQAALRKPSCCRRSRRCGRAWTVLSFFSPLVLFVGREDVLPSVAREGRGEEGNVLTTKPYLLSSRAGAAEQTKQNILQVVVAIVPLRPITGNTLLRIAT